MLKIATKTKLSPEEAIKQAVELMLPLVLKRREPP